MGVPSLLQLLLGVTLVCGRMNVVLSARIIVGVVAPHCICMYVWVDGSMSFSSITWGCLLFGKCIRSSPRRKVNGTMTVFVQRVQLRGNNNSKYILTIWTVLCHFAEELLHELVRSSRVFAKNDSGR